MSEQQQFPPLPAIFTLPKATIEQWLQVPESEDINVRVSRAEIDNLFSSINNLANSQSALQEALISYSNGNLEQANLHMDRSKRSNIEGINALRTFVGALMASAIQHRQAKHDQA